MGLLQDYLKRLRGLASNQVSNFRVGMNVSRNPNQPIQNRMAQGLLQGTGKALADAGNLALKAQSSRVANVLNPATLMIRQNQPRMSNEINQFRTNLNKIAPTTRAGKFGSFVGENLPALALPTTKGFTATKVASPAMRFAGNSLLRGAENAAIGSAYRYARDEKTTPGKVGMDMLVGGGINAALSPLDTIRGTSEMALNARDLIKKGQVKYDALSDVVARTGNVKSIIERLNESKLTRGLPNATKRRIANDLVDETDRGAIFDYLSQYYPKNSKIKVNSYTPGFAKLPGGEPKSTVPVPQQTTKPMPNTAKEAQQLQKSVAQLTQTENQPTSLMKSTNKEIPQPQLKSSITKSFDKSIAQPSKYYNVKNLKISDKAKSAIQTEVKNATEQLQNTVGGKLTNKETAKLADKTSRILKTTVTREETAQKIAANLNLRRKIADVAKSGKVDPGFINLWIKDKAAGEDIARQLQARRMVANPKDASTIDAILEGIYKTNKNADEILKAARGVDFNDPKQATEFYRTFVKPKAGEWIDLLRYNSMLSSPNTHIVNLSSNYQGSGIVAPIEKTVTGMVDAVKSALTGQKREYFAGEGAAYAKGYYSSVGKAFKAFSDVMTGKSLNNNPDIRNIPLATKGIQKGVESTLSVPMKLLEAGDQFFTALTSGGSEAALKYKAGKGVKLSNISGLASDEAAYRLFRSETGLKQQGHILNAIDFFTNKIQEARGHENPIVSTISKFTLPFVKTPMNILKQGVEYSPLGVSTLWGASNKTEQLSKAILGTTSALGVATLLGSDRLTWAEPTNAKQKAAFRAAGMQPYSVKIGDKWISYSKLHPAIAFNFALVSAIDDALKQKRMDDSTADSILSGFAKYANFMADQSYVKNIGDFVSGVKGDTTGFSKMVSNYPNQLVPFRALLGWVNRLTDPLQRTTTEGAGAMEKQLQYFMQQIPGLSQKTPARTDESGNPIENQNRAINAFSPARITTENPNAKNDYNQIMLESKANKELADLKKTNKTTKSINNGVRQLSDGTYAVKIGSKLKQFDNKEEANRAIEKDNFDKSGKKSALINGTYYYKDKAGKTRDLSEDEFNMKMTTAKLEAAYDSKNYKQYITVAEEKLKLIEAQYESADPLTQIELQNDYNDLLAKVNKYKSYGGFKKPKKAKASRLKSVVIKSPSIKTSTKIKISKPTITKKAITGGRGTITKVNLPVTRRRTA